MPSQLIKNEGITFLACKPFTYRGTPYSIGDDFPQEEANNIETLVRARFIIPVLEEGYLRPRHWHGHIRTREQAEEYLNRDRVQLRMPHEPDSDEVVNLEQLTYPHTTPEPEGEGEPALPEEKVIDSIDEPGTESESAPDEPEADSEPDEVESLEETYDPAEHNVPAVLEYIDEHPEQKDAVLALEAAGRGRKGILEE
jgi:hypothetical protein